MIRVLASNICSTILDDRCPDFLEFVLRKGIPVLAKSSNPEEFPQVSTKFQDYQEKVKNNTKLAQLCVSKITVTFDFIDFKLLS